MPKRPRSLPVSTLLNVMRRRSSRESPCTTRTEAFPVPPNPPFCVNKIRVGDVKTMETWKLGRETTVSATKRPSTGGAGWEGSVGLVGVPLPPQWIRKAAKRGRMSFARVYFMLKSASGFWGFVR